MQRKIITLTLALFCFLVSHAAFVDSASADLGKRDKLSKYGTLMKSAQGGVTVKMATYSKKNKDGLHDVLVMVTGQAAEADGIDGKVIRYAAVPGGTGFDLKYKEGKRTFNRMSSRQRWGSYKSVDLFLGNETFKMWVDQRGSKDVGAYQLQTLYLNQQKAKMLKKASKKK